MSASALPGRSPHESLPLYRLKNYGEPAHFQPQPAPESEAMKIRVFLSLLALTAAAQSAFDRIDLGRQPADSTAT